MYIECLPVFKLKYSVYLNLRLHSAAQLKSSKLNQSKFEKPFVIITQQKSLVVFLLLLFLSVNANVSCH